MCKCIYTYTYIYIYVYIFHLTLLDCRSLARRFISLQAPRQHTWYWVFLLLIIYMSHIMFVRLKTSPINVTHMERLQTEKLSGRGHLTLAAMSSRAYIALHPVYIPDPRSIASYICGSGHIQHHCQEIFLSFLSYVHMALLIYFYPFQDDMSCN